MPMCGCLSCALPSGDLAHKLGMCSDWESNLHPFGFQAGTQSTEPYLLGYSFIFNGAGGFFPASQLLNVLFSYSLFIVIFKFCWGLFLFAFFK